MTAVGTLYREKGVTKTVYTLHFGIQVIDL